MCEIASRATQAKDYVLSVWTEWDFYTIPQDFETMSPFQLLADALRQLHNAMHAVVPTVCPAGLFGATQQTATLSAHVEMANGPVKDSSQLYGLFVWTYRVHSSDIGRLPLKVQGGEPYNCGATAQILDSWLSSLDVPTILVWACCTFDNFEYAKTRLYDLRGNHTSFAKLARQLSSSNICEQIEGCKRTVLMLFYHALMHYRAKLQDVGRYVQDIPDTWQSNAHGSPGLVQSFGHLLLANLSRESGLDFDVLMRKIPKTVFGEAFFEIFCHVLALDFELCKAKGVEVFVDEFHALEKAGPGIEGVQDNKVDNNALEAEESGDGGLMNDEWLLSADKRYKVAGPRTCIGLVHWATFCHAQQQGKRFMTVASDQAPYTPLYEVIGESVQSQQWRVIGVWLPLRKEYKASEVGGWIVNEDEANAFVI
ncbi:hypothetical protein H2200_012365 [Cladophialophora chaetospira]|uniref:Uncharacterized protein n=1 Tax=Cladophialophora chaetospira TaxID=386627 RepID=A0AA38WXP9_9EURO|nr:hypothetical protein H2200_012365 [Cladophialophora chaetospira]